MDQTLTGAVIEEMLADALVEYAENFGEEERKQSYLKNRDKAHAAHMQTLQLAGADPNDIRLYEMLACGFDPADAPCRAWFLSMNDDDRRELVQMSRRLFIVTIKLQRRRRRLILDSQNLSHDRNHPCPN